MTLEDHFTDILTKAQRGWNLDDANLARLAGIDVEDWRALKSGKLDQASLAKVAPVLRLHFAALLAIARDAYVPEPIEKMAGLRAFESSFHGMLVNSFLVWDPATHEAAFFDTGGDARPMLEATHALGLTVRQIFITHTHSDHIHDLPQLLKKTGAPVFVGDKEPLEGASTFPIGTRFHIGQLTIDTLSTFGHSRGGTTYFIQGLARPVAIVGDALFAGSMGGGAFSYQDALATNRSRIFTLPGETIICPGHGPLTTVAEQKRANPFFVD